VIILSIVKVTFFVAIAILTFSLTGLVGLMSTDFQRELATIEFASSNKSKYFEQSPNDPNVLFNEALYYFQKSSLTGSPQDIEKADRIFNNVPAIIPRPADLYLLNAAFDLKLHRLGAAKINLEKLSFMENDPKVLVLKADIAVQEGNYSTALTNYQEIIEKNRTWDNLARLAYLRAKFGDFKSADQIYAAAEEELSAKDMRSYAWVELQRGYLALSRGQYEEAWTQYQRADQAYSGYWLTKEYKAEWLATQRDFEAAIALYKQVIACTRRPELYHALGDLYAFMGQPKLAKPWHDKALTVYLDSVRRGDVQYYHHLASFYADARLDGAEAVKWARKDLLLRQNATTRDALAWALFRNGRYPEAVDEIKQALLFKWQDAHLFFHAGMIYLAAGRTAEGKSYLQRAFKINPHYDSFHVHR